MKKMFPKFKFIFLVLGIASFVACEKEEGMGGTASISGTLMVKTYDRDFKVLQDISPAIDEDVFIIFGDDDVVGENTSTSYNGKFEFSYLREGKYTIFYASEDSLSPIGDDKEQLVSVTLNKGQTLDLGELFQYNTIDFNDGTSVIKGRVQQINYWDVPGKQDVVAIDTSSAQELEIYITYGDDAFYSERIRTQEDGTFEFKGLIKGQYRIFMYSDDIEGGSEKIIIESDVSTESHGQVTDIGDLFVYNSVDFDDGKAVIKGRVRQINYWKQSVYPNLIVRDTTAAQELEIYLTLNESGFYEERIRTQDDGTFEFRNLITGNYRVFLFSEDVSGGEANLVVEANVKVEQNGQVINIGDLFVENH